jgi:hypothetical protein
MPGFGLNGFNTERDISLAIYDPITGSTQNFAIKTGWDRKQLTTRIQVKGLNGIVYYAEDPEGWEGSLDLERGSSVLDDFIASLENVYYTGGAINGSTIVESIGNPDGTTSQYRYEGCAFKLSEAGKWEKGAAVKQKLDFVCSFRRKIA